MFASENRVKIIEMIDPKTKEVEKYQMELKVIGQGKYGKVYKATHIDRRQKVFAVKVIRFDPENPKIRQQYLKELQIIKHLPKSQHLVQIHPQHLQSQNNFYIFEEFCDGGNLAEHRMKKGKNPFTEDEVFNLFYQVSLGFIDLIEGKIFHEDIKPQNILIKNGVYKLTDFGISQHADKFQISAVRKGTLLYMPPEKLKSPKYVPTAQSEMFSLGITLFESIFGHHPYLKSKPNDYKDYLKMLQTASVRSISSLKQDFPNSSLAFDRLIRFLMRMIELNSVKRLSLHELKEYITKDEPFTSIIVRQSEDNIPKLNKRSKINYQVTEFSKIVMRSSMPTQGMLGSFTRENILFTTECYRSGIELIKEISLFLQQGVYYSKESKITQYIKNLGTNFSNITQIEYLQLICAFLNDELFQQISRSFNQFVINSNLENYQQLNFEDDVEFVKNQFLKIFTESNFQHKKETIQKFKEEGGATEFLAETIGEIYDSIGGVRIYYKEDLLSVLFSKYAAKILSYTSEITKMLKEEEGIKQAIKSAAYKNSKEILKQFSELESMKKDQLLQFFRTQMKSEQKQMWEQAQSNSDEFQILEFDEE